jgi:hypothetical protein
MSSIVAWRSNDRISRRYSLALDLLQRALDRDVLDDRRFWSPASSATTISPIKMRPMMLSPRCRRRARYFSIFPF